MLLLILGLFALYAFFVLSSTAIFRARVKRVRELGREGTPGARLARVILMRSGNYLLTCQVGMFATAMAAGIYLMQTANSETFDSWVNVMVSPGQPYYATVRLAWTVLFFSLMVLVALVIVQVGKAVALRSPERILCAVGFAVIFLSRVIRPLVAILAAVANWLVTISGMRMPIERTPTVSAEEINEMVERSSEAGEIEDDEKEMIQGVFAFSEKIVREVMTERTDVVYTHIDSDLRAVVQIFVSERVSRILVVGENLDDVKGILLSKDLIPMVGVAGNDFDINRLMRPAYFVPNTKNVGDLLEEFRANAVHFAVVLDEHGGVDGVVTVEDLLEEIVGEIFDEYDSPSEGGVSVTKTRSGDLLIDGATPVEMLNENFGLDFPRGEYNTIAGFVIHSLGRMPEVGEIVEHGPYRIRVERVTENRITLVRLLLTRKVGDLRVVESPGARQSGGKSPAGSTPSLESQDERKARISGSR